MTRTTKMVLTICISYFSLFYFFCNNEINEIIVFTTTIIIIIIVILICTACNCVAKCNLGMRKCSVPVMYVFHCFFSYFRIFIIMIIVVTKVWSADMSNWPNHFFQSIEFYTEILTLQPVIILVMSLVSKKKMWKNRKIRARNNSVFGHFSRSDSAKKSSKVGQNKKTLICLHHF